MSNPVPNWGPPKIHTILTYGPPLQIKIRTAPRATLSPVTGKISSKYPKDSESYCLHRDVLFRRIFNHDGLALYNVDGKAVLDKNIHGDTDRIQIFYNIG